jgi:NADPH2:quinone reductase
MTETTHVVRLHETGAPDVLKWEEAEVGEPRRGEVRVRHTAVGLNFVDTVIRRGRYAVMPEFPVVPGGEAAGVVEAVGEGVSGIEAGDRVAYGTAGFGSYSQKRVLAAERVFVLPDVIPDDIAAAMMLKGMTAAYLLTRTYVVKPGDPILIHAAAGGVGTILSQWAKHIGATVIGTVSSEAKAAYAKAHGCDHVLIYGTGEWNGGSEVKELTGGGVAVAYDSVGRNTFQSSIDSLRPIGMLVSFGSASGMLTPEQGAVMAAKQSYLYGRVSLANYAGTREGAKGLANALFDVVAKGLVKIEVEQHYPLKDVAQAHADLEGRKTTGCTVLVP